VLFHAISSRGTNTGQDFLLIARNASDGSKLWTRRYDGPGHGEDHVSNVAVSPDGSRVYETGFSTGRDGTYDWATLAYNAATGRRLWLRRLSGTKRGVDLPSELVVDPQGGRVFVAGSTVNAGTHGDATTVAYDADIGKRLWTQRFDGSAHRGDGALDIVASRDGSRVFVAGGGIRTRSGPDAKTIAYDAATGGLRGVGSTTDRPQRAGALAATTLERSASRPTGKRCTSPGRP
jgi:outer membrane protein assembly factor BamB